MIYRNTTQVPNSVFDVHLPSLSFSELKVLLVIVRQTNGWFDKRTGRRKVSDRISQSQFMKKTGMCRRSISPAIASLVAKGLIEVKDRRHMVVTDPKARRGKWLWYSLVQHKQHNRLTRIKSIGEVIKTTHHVA